DGTGSLDRIQDRGAAWRAHRSEIESRTGHDIHGVSAGQGRAAAAFGRMSHLARGPSVLGIDSKANAAGGRRVNAGSRQLTSAEAALHEIPPSYAYCHLARG